MVDVLPTPFRFDDRAITWRPLKGFDGLYLWVVGVNPVRQKVDILFRLDPGARCPAHRHVGPTDTFVLEGEHRTYARREADGPEHAAAWQLDQIRPPAFFAMNEGDHLHFEEGGATQGCIVLLSMTAVDGVIWEVLDDTATTVTSRMTIDDFQRVLDRQAPIPLG